MRCIHCEEKFEKKYPNQIGRFKYCLKNDECIKAFNQVKKKYYEDQQEKKRKKESRFKKSLNPSIYHPELKKDLQNAINKISRLIDKGCRCIDCERTTPNPCWDGGHRVSIGDHPALRYHLDNIFKQDRYCNSISEGNKQFYNDGIKQMYGNEYYNYIDGLKRQYPTLKMPHSELPGKIKEARKIVKELQKIDLDYSPKTRIELRNKYNKRLGMYTIHH